MSMVSHAAGARFHALIGAPMLSFYDWYADLPVASPQVFGDQTDVAGLLRRGEVRRRVAVPGAGHRRRAASLRPPAQA